MSNAKRIYFVGIKGVGMASLAIIAKEAGLTVRGSDVAEEFITDKILLEKGIKIDMGFEIEDIKRFIGENILDILVITTAAHDGLSNPQSAYALEKGIKVLTHGQAVGYFMEGSLFGRTFKGISILGCHGKTTITAMMATAFASVNLDPTYSVGTSELFPFGAGGHYGKSDYFIAEADEFVSDAKLDRTIKFLYQYPKYVVLNNIDFDHPDVYKDLDEVRETFQKFALENINENGTVIANGDDNQVLGIRSQVLGSRKDIKVITYGESEGNDYKILNFRDVGWGSEFEVLSNGSSLGKFKLSVPGSYNAKNALSVIALMNELKIPLEQIKKGISTFQGTKRRQEMLGHSKNGAIIIDDYAHHPEEIQKTLNAIKNAYPDKKILAVFQPHTLSRTQALWKEFAGAFTNANQVLFLPIFTSKREGDTDYVQLYSSIKKSMQDLGTKVKFLANEGDSVVEYIIHNFDSDEWIVVTLGAGDVYKIGYGLVRR